MAVSSGFHVILLYSFVCCDAVSPHFSDFNLERSWPESPFAFEKLFYLSVFESVAFQLSVYFKPAALTYENSFSIGNVGDLKSVFVKILKLSVFEK